MGYSSQLCAYWRSRDKGWGHLQVWVTAVSCEPTDDPAIRAEGIYMQECRYSSKLLVKLIIIVLPCYDSGRSPSIHTWFSVTIVTSPIGNSIAVHWAHISVHAFSLTWREWSWAISVTLTEGYILNITFSFTESQIVSKYLLPRHRYTLGAAWK